MDRADREGLSSTGVRLATNLPPQARDLFERYGLALVLAAIALFLRGQLPLPEGTASLRASDCGGGPERLVRWTRPRLVHLHDLRIGTPVLVHSTGEFIRTAVGPWLGFIIFIALGLLLSEFSSGRRRVQHAFRASEERFHALVQFSFDVYWETDAAASLHAAGILRTA